MFILDYSVHKVHTNLKFNLSKIIFAYSTVLQVEKKDQSFISHSKASVNWQPSCIHCLQALWLGGQ